MITQTLLIRLFYAVKHCRFLTGHYFCTNQAGAQIEEDSSLIILYPPNSPFFRQQVFKGRSLW
jgi:hypothetical protein